MRGTRHSFGAHYEPVAVDARLRRHPLATIGGYLQVDELPVGEPLNRLDHPMRELYELENVILLPHLTFYTAEAMQRLEEETLERCLEVIERRPVTIKSADPRLQPDSAATRSC